MGMSPRRLALTLALGFVLGCLPMVGLPTAPLCAAGCGAEAESAGDPGSELRGHAAAAHTDPTLRADGALDVCHRAITGDGKDTSARIFAGDAADLGAA